MPRGRCRKRERLEEEDEGYREGFYYPWDQEKLAVAEPLDRVSLNNVQMRFITVVSLQPKLATAHSKLVTHTLGLANRVFGGAPAAREPEQIGLALPDS